MTTNEWPGVGAYVAVRYQKMYSRVALSSPAKADRFIEKVKEVLGDDLEMVHKISLKPIQPPEGHTTKKGHYWCPYCGMDTIFKKRVVYEYCTICSMSDVDFHIRNINGLWKKGRP